MVSVGAGDNGRTVVLNVGAELMVSLPNPSERELSDEMVRSSDASILQLLSDTQGIGRSQSVLRVPFRALRVGWAEITATGKVPFGLQVEVVA
ncbi:MAG: hypothetical protein WCB86_09800 [Candidatus Dormiibacterota bacterium]